jgi:hypothetical protein
MNTRFEMSGGSRKTMESDINRAEQKGVNI